MLDSAGRVLDGARGYDNLAGRAVFTTLVVTAVLLLFVGRWGALSSPRRALRLPNGVGRIAVDEFAAVLRYELVMIAVVEAAQVRVENHHRRGVIVEAILDVVPEARLSEAGATARACLTKVVEERVGLTLAAPPRIDIRYRELWLRPAAEGSASGVERPTLHELVRAESKPEMSRPVRVMRQNEMSEGAGRNGTRLNNTVRRNDLDG